MRRTLAFGLVALAALAAGCGERAEPLRELAQPYPVTARGAGDRPTVLTALPQRIVALDPGSAELLAALGTGERLVGVPAGIGVAKGAAEVVRAAGQVVVEEVVDLAPDLIVATPGTDQVDVSRAERESGAAVYIQPAASIADVERAAVELGFLIGEPVKARRLVTRIRAALARVEERIAAAEPVTVFVDTGFFITVPEHSLLGDLLRRARGESVAGPNPDPEPFPFDELARRDPEVYLTTSESRVTLETLRRNPQTRELSAIREGRFAVLPVDLVTRAGPRVARALAAVAEVLHPDAFR